MNSFELLHPALQHHLVNTLGWRELRPMQQQAIPTLINGHHALILAPTAGGKTEAAFFPLLSRILSENLGGLSLLYVCPLKALLNNLTPRLTQYCEMVGRKAALWHGDIPDSEKKRILNDPPDCLLTTPESLEVMLLSRRVDNVHFFGNLRAVIIDEIHSFASDDRGWHLLSILERITKLASRELQRIGLSATVGNPNELLDWMSGHCDGEREIIAPSSPKDNTTAAANDVRIDYVGKLSNAATIISRMYQGEKRLVFCDSRSKAEQLTVLLRDSGVNAHISHSSLGREQRSVAEAAFTNTRDAVIVATSTLELGIDIGDLDRVIQIDAPATVSSFLQRMGRTGRRSGNVSNCLFLATNDRSLFQSAGIVRLWKDGYVDPVTPPPLPFHIFAQQIMALALQEGGIGINTWQDYIGRMPGFSAMCREHIQMVLKFMIDVEILSLDEGILHFGIEGEATFGRKNFMELFSTFTAPPLYNVRYGETDVGQIHQITIISLDEHNPAIQLGGKTWNVVHVEWNKRIVYVRPGAQGAISRWAGSLPIPSVKITKAIRELLTSNEIDPCWSQRSQARIIENRLAFDYLYKDGTTMIESPENNIWWTFAGLIANRTIAANFKHLADRRITYDEFSVRITPKIERDEFTNIIDRLKIDNVPDTSIRDMDKYLDDLKFSVCLPLEISHLMFLKRFNCEKILEQVFSKPINFEFCKL